MMSASGRKGAAVTAAATALALGTVSASATPPSEMQLPPAPSLALHFEMMARHVEEQWSLAWQQRVLEVECIIMRGCG